MAQKQQLQNKMATSLPTRKRARAPDDGAAVDRSLERASTAGASATSSACLALATNDAHITQSPHSAPPAVPRPAPSTSSAGCKRAASSSSAPDAAAFTEETLQTDANQRNVQLVNTEKNDPEELLLRALEAELEAPHTFNGTAGVAAALALENVEEDDDYDESEDEEQ